MTTIAVFNGPNLNMLGKRDPDYYGTETLHDVEQLCRDTAHEEGHDLVFMQTNHEGVFIDGIHEATRTADAIVINAGAWTHTSIAIHDALELFEGPVVEVHLSHIHQREDFRSHSFISMIADALICGAGAHGYRLAVLHAAHLLNGR
ncbi:type II 3-dehydroquinate dehydratase [Stomatohabitans albus]|uniref:type II 3-dehydroquinate dehydratase n=1 Tax=Stomatohabitans albus TaxID=3110766 RepID=UPI00300CE0D3